MVLFNFYRCSRGLHRQRADAQFFDCVNKNLPHKLLSRHCIRYFFQLNQCCYSHKESLNCMSENSLSKHTLERELFLFLFFFSFIYLLVPAG